MATTPTYDPWNALRDQYATALAGIGQTTPPLVTAARLASERTDFGLSLFEAARALAKTRDLTPSSRQTVSLISKAMDIHAGLTRDDACEDWTNPAASLAAVKRESQLYFRSGVIPGRAGRDVALARAAITYVNSDLRRRELDHRVLGVLYHERPGSDDALAVAFEACRHAGRRLIATGEGRDILKRALQEAEAAGATFSQAFQTIHHAIEDWPVSTTVARTIVSSGD